MKSVIAIVVLALCGWGLYEISTRERLPIEGSSRPSFVLQGRVLRLKNTSDRPLPNLRITTSSGSWRFAKPVAPGETVEASWMNAQAFESGQWILLSAPGYLPEPCQL